MDWRFATGCNGWSNFQQVLHTAFNDNPTKAVTQIAPLLLPVVPDLIPISDGISICHYKGEFVNLLYIDRLITSLNFEPLLVKDVAKFRRCAYCQAGGYSIDGLWKYLFASFTWCLPKKKKDESVHSAASRRKLQTCSQTQHVEQLQVTPSCGLVTSAPFFEMLFICWSLIPQRSGRFLIWFVCFTTMLR